MAQSFVTDAGTLFIPGSYSTQTVQQSNSGLATNGVLFLVGEADAGPDFTLEADLGSNSFGPDQIGDVLAKYKSGNLVDAYNAATDPANDASIVGSFSTAILVKSNPSTSATSPVVKFDSTSYGTLRDKSYGKLGNLISWQVAAATAEVVPNTGTFALMLPIASTNISVRANGGTATPLTLSPLETPAAMIAAIDGVAGVDVTGGTSQVPVGSVTGTLALTVVSGNKVEIDYSVPFQGTVPSVGDTMFIPAASVLASVHASNAGSYIVTGSSASQILATKLLDVTGTPAQLTPPVAQTAINVVSTTNDLESFAAVTIKSVAANPIDGFSKSLEIAELTSGTGLLSTLCYVLSSSVPVPVTFISKTASPTLLTSTAEYSASLTDARQSDNISEVLTTGGQIALTVGYLGTTATLVNNGTTLVITVAGGAGTSPATINLKDWKTIASLAVYIASLTGFTAAPGTAVLGSQSPLTLDQGTFNICGTFATSPGRIKQDASRFYTNLLNNAVLVQLVAQAAAGLPAPTTAVAFLSGGTKGATTDAIYTAAMNALALVRGNFLVPLFSRDATGDIADNLTEPTSSYTIASINAASRSHVLKMSTLKARRNRQCFLSSRDTFANDQIVSANLASARAVVAFQDSMDTSATTGSIVQYQPWMTAVKAAAMQAAGGYRAIFNKGINISGAVQAAGDFNDQDDDAVEKALQAGLLIVRRDENGLLKFVSDQTTYGADNNFVYNSIQATYAADVIALTTAQRMEKAFVGQSIADVGASLALGVLEAIMADMFRLKLIAVSDDAPKGFKNAKIKISGPVMRVSIEVKLAGAIYFIPIDFAISQVTQSA